MGATDTPMAKVTATRTATVIITDIRMSTEVTDILTKEEEEDMVTRTKVVHMGTATAALTRKSWKE